MKEIKKWLEKAEKDLEDAKFNLDNNRFEVAAFLSHQAAEKALKALYILKFKRLWKTHDLVGLLVKVGRNKQLQIGCEELNRHYINTRYPVEFVYTKEVSQNAVKEAEKVLKWVKKKIK